MPWSPKQTKFQVSEQTIRYEFPILDHKSYFTNQPDNQTQEQNGYKPHYRHKALTSPRNAPSPRPPTPYSLPPQRTPIKVPLVLKFISLKLDFMNTPDVSYNWEQKITISLRPDTMTHESFVRSLEVLMIDLGMPCDLGQVNEKITAEIRHGPGGRDIVNVKAEKWQELMEDAREGNLKEFKVLPEARDHRWGSKYIGEVEAVWIKSRL